jgi:hypothetical protein
MDPSVTFLALIVILCCLNIMPWIFLCVKRPDRSILDQLEASDSALAGLFQHLMSRVDAMQELGNSATENPLLSILEIFMKQRLNTENLLDRNEYGQFNATTQEDQDQTSTQDHDFFNGTR